MSIADNPGTQPENKEIPPSVETDSGTPPKTDDGKRDTTPPPTETGDDTQLKLDTFTKDEVNEIIRKRLARYEEGVPKKYGAETLEQLQDFIEKGKGYDELKLAHDNTVVEMEALQEKLLFIENNIDVKRYDDVKAYFKGKELSLTPENLKAELTTHPEWLAQRSVQTIGGQRQQAPVKDERKAAFELFGIRK